IVALHQTKEESKQRKNETKFGEYCKSEFELWVVSGSGWPSLGLS
ncbi:hypothetical protein ACN38_g6750, partial [Penicillium nordicum]